MFDLSSVVTVLAESPGFRLVDLSVHIALITQQLHKLPDIHDRLIVATALAHNATLITADRAVSQSGYLPVVW